VLRQTAGGEGVVRAVVYNSEGKEERVGLGGGTQRMQGTVSAEKLMCGKVISMSRERS